MDKRNLLSFIGILIYIFMFIIDKCFYKIHDFIYVIVGIIAIIIIIIGFIRNNKN